MYKALTFVCLLFFSVGQLHAKRSNDLAKQPTCVISEEAPCSFVNDTVNVIGGNFYLQMHHLSVPGHVPLDLVQYYNSKSNYTSWFGTGMSLNYSFAVSTTLDSGKKRDKHGKYHLTYVETPGGSVIRCLGEFKPTSKSDHYLDPEVIHDGFTNCGSGAVSARTNLKNIRFAKIPIAMATLTGPAICQMALSEYIFQFSICLFRMCAMRSAQIEQSWILNTIIIQK